MQGPERRRKKQTHIWEHFEDLGGDGKDPAGVHLVAQLGARRGVPPGGEEEGRGIAAARQRHPTGGRRGESRREPSEAALPLLGEPGCVWFLLEVAGLLLVLLPLADLQVPPSLEQVRGFHPGEHAEGLRR